MIDLHAHTDESDGTDTPGELIRRATEMGLDALAITDHDTFAGYDRALPDATAAGFDLICGIELSTKHENRTVHLLAYFLGAPPAAGFRIWLADLHRSRRDRNVRLAARLQSLGVDVKLEEVEALGRGMTGRPHFARIIVGKGYAANIQQAFTDYLAESGSAFVERDEVMFPEAVQRVLEAGGLPVLAHPARLGKQNRAQEEPLIAAMCAAGLRGIEVYHSDHMPWHVERYLSYAAHYGLAITGGSDYHGDAKPHVRLGQCAVPRSVLDDLRAGAVHR